MWIIYGGLLCEAWFIMILSFQITRIIPDKVKFIYEPHVCYSVHFLILLLFCRLGH